MTRNYTAHSSNSTFLLLYDHSQRLQSWIVSHQYTTKGDTRGIGSLCIENDPHTWGLNVRVSRLETAVWMVGRICILYNHQPESSPILAFAQEIVLTSIPLVTTWVLLAGLNNMSLRQ